MSTRPNTFSSPVTGAPGEDPPPVTPGSGRWCLSTRSAQDTERLACELARWLIPGDTVALYGDLGAGKTCFTRGLARGLGVDPDVPVTSPTFTLFNRYNGAVELCHFDLYRLDDVDELEAVGYFDIPGSPVVTVVEWADRVSEAIPARVIHVRLDGLGEERSLTIQLDGLPEERARGLDALLRESPWILA